MPGQQSGLRLAATGEASLPPVLPREPSPRRAPDHRRKPTSWVLRIVLLVVLAFFTFMAVRVVQFVNYVRENSRRAERAETAAAHIESPGESAFREANRQITVNKGTVAFGNNPAAIALATEYSRSLKMLREDLFTEGKENAVSLAKGEMLTYCQLNANSCVFLVHVPELRRFTREAKDALNKLAWMNAQSTLKSKAANSPKHLAVGVRGAVLYESIAVGVLVAEPSAANDGVRDRAAGMSGLSLLYPFFSPAGPVTNRLSARAPRQ